MSHVFHSPQVRDRERTRALLTEFFKRQDGPWRSEAKLAFRSFHINGDERRFPPNMDSVRHSECLLAKLEGAARHVDFELRGLWMAGIHFIPGHELVHTKIPEGFVLFDGKGRFSPMIVGHEEILLQCGEYPLVF
ncbi:MAG: hypothetical protein V1861_05400, partial [Candidatus Micrarchaeota archaeon]